VDNDTAQPGLLQFGNAAYSVSENSGQALISVVRVSGSNVPVAVHYATSNGTAADGQDYTSTSGTLTFNPGETVKHFSVPILTNSPVERSETLNLSLSAPTGGASLGFPSSAVLTIVDGSQSLASCDEATLRAAVSAGGRVSLPCDGTIYLTSPLLIQNPVLLDASGHTLTLSGSNITRLFTVYPGVSLDLRNLTLSDGFATGSTGNPGFGGAIQNNGGQVSLADCILLQNLVQGGPSVSASGSVAGNAFGGAIYSSDGIVWTSNTLFVSNTCLGGQGLGNGSSGKAYGGTLCQIGGESLLWNCRFENNTVTSPTPAIAANITAGAGSASGGAIYHSIGVLIVTSCDFATNSAIGGTSQRIGEPGAGRGGAIFGESVLGVSNCTFVGNLALAGQNGNGGPNGEGGALYLMQPASVSTSVFVGNTARAGKGYTGGAGVHPGGAAYGGNIYSLATLTLTDSTLASGKADGASFVYFGGAPGMSAFGGGLFSSGTVRATNVTFSGNQAIGGAYSCTNCAPFPDSAGGNANGGALCNVGGSVYLVHATFESNVATGGPGSPFGLSLGGGILNNNGNVTLINSIVANSPSGGNAFGPLVDAGHNISTDASCGFSAPGSLNNTDPLLGSLGYFGGPTPTIPLLAGSPAIDAADNNFAPPTDQRGLSRPYGAAADIGAYEFGATTYTVVGQVSGYAANEQVLVAASTYYALTTNGQYSLTGLPPGTYSVSPSHPNYVFFPTSREVTVGPDQFDVNFKAYRWHALTLEGVFSNVISVMYAGTDGHTVRILSSTNLIDWSPVSTNVVGSSNLLQLSFPILLNPPKLFYRAFGN
jgi:fibronectin-binding autotransporter adhesin